MELAIGLLDTGLFSVKFQSDGTGTADTAYAVPMLV